jgi:DNA-binding SARP family transcriptional activator
LEWCVSERANLERWFVRSASVVARHHAELGNQDRAARVGDEILSVDPYNEEALSIVLAAYVATGNHVAGEHRCREYRNLVVTELGEQPSVKIEMVYESLYLDSAGGSRRGTHRGQ